MESVAKGETKSSKYKFEAEAAASATGKFKVAELGITLKVKGSDEADHVFSGPKEGGTFGRPYSSKNSTPIIFDRRTTKSFFAYKMI